MSIDYFHLIDNEEQILWVIKEYGEEAIELVLDNIRQECADMYKKLDKGMKVIYLIEKILKEQKNKEQSIKDKNIIDISEYFKNNHISSKSPINQNIFIFSEKEK